VEGAWVEGKGECREGDAGCGPSTPRLYILMVWPQYAVFYMRKMCTQYVENVAPGCLPFLCE
jgi:hypothetical protein